MRTKTIKVSFEHPNYIYPFKLSLGDNFVNMERVMVKETEKAFEDIVSLVVLTEQ